MRSQSFLALLLSEPWVVTFTSASQPDAHPSPSVRWGQVEGAGAGYFSPAQVCWALVKPKSPRLWRNIFSWERRVLWGLHSCQSPAAPCKPWFPASACLSLQFSGCPFALWPRFFDGSKKECWFSVRSAFFIFPLWVMSFRLFPYPTRNWKSTLFTFAC